MSQFIETSEHEAIRTALARGVNNLIITACAGSGKTTTALWLLGHIPRDPSLLMGPSICFLAFNRNIADNLKTKVPRGVNATTFHALGFAALKDSGIIDRTCKVDGKKCMKYVYDRMRQDDPDLQQVLRLVSVMKGQVGELTKDDCLALISRFDLSFEEPAKAVGVALSVLEASNRDLKVIDFDDMLYLAVRHNARFAPQDFVFVDEAQDTNNIQLEILERLQKPPILNQVMGAENPHKVRAELENITYYEAKGRNLGDCYNKPKSPTRFVFVGDPNQAIYGFRGANADSMDRIARRFNAQSFPLSVCYRCSVAVVEEAQRVLTQPI